MTHSFHGRSIVAGQLSTTSGRTFRAVSPLDSTELEPLFYESDQDDVEHALRQAEEAFAVYRRVAPQARAEFLERIADEIAALGDGLLERCHLETGLPIDRLTGERARTCG